MLPRGLSKVIEQFERLPGVGRRTAERYAYELLKKPANLSQDLAESLKSLHTSVKYCPKTFALIEIDQEVSPLYNNSNRDKQSVAVVAYPQDVIVMESTGQFKGTYHVLKGLLSPIDGVKPADLTVQELVERIDEDQVEELILAISANIEGESTATYITNQLKDKDITISRLARGLPAGVDLEYADEMTLAKAIQGRRPIDG